MAKKKATTKSSTPTRRHKTEQALARAINRATNPALLRKIVNTAAKMEGLAIEDRGPVNTIELSVTILKGKETRNLVEHFMRSDDEEGIADTIGCVIAASRMTGKA
jgi:hypothetical protein